MRANGAPRDRILIYIIVAVVGSLAMLWTLSYIFRAGDVNSALMRTTREAIEAAREAREDAEITRRASSALRVIALAAGVVAPLVVVYLVFRLHARSEPGAGDLLDMMRREKLLPTQGDQRQRLPGTGYRLLDERRAVQTMKRKIDPGTGVERPTAPVLLSARWDSAARETACTNDVGTANVALLERGGSDGQLQRDREETFSGV